MRDPGKRLKILTKSEIQELYGLPIFTYEERAKYFSLNREEQTEAEVFSLLQAKVYFILQLGYFKAKRIFFTFALEEVREDTRYVLQQYFSQTEELDSIVISKTTRFRQQQAILKLLNYQICTKEIKNELQEKANYWVTIFTKPVYIFKELLNFLENNKIVIPGYSIMQDIVGKSLIYERKRLEIVIKQDIPELARSGWISCLQSRKGFMS